MTPNARSVEARTVEMSRIAREACENAYREGFEAGAKAMRDKCANLLDLSGEIEDAIRELPLPTPTTKGGA